jgi:predicted Zn finger-like uncharacterized protein
MTQMVTRCPKCATAFRITSTQLESAKGAVRCGSCLHIFKAQDFLVKSAAPETTTQGTPQPAAVIAEKTEAAKIDALTPEASKPEVKPTLAATPIAEQPEATGTEAIKIEATKIEVTKTEATKVEVTAPIAVQASPQSIAKAPDTNSKPATPAVSESEPATFTPVINKASALEDEDEDVLISDDMDKVDDRGSAYEFDGFVDLDLQPKQTVSLFEREIRYDELKDDKDKEEADESWAEDLLDDDEETLHQLKKAPPPLAPAMERDLDISTDSTNEAARGSESGYSGPIFSLVSESATDIKEEPKAEHDGKAEHNDEEDHDGFSEAFLSATRAPETTATTTASSEFAAALFETQPDENEQAEKATSKRPVKSSKIRAFDTSRAALLMNIMPAPVEFTARRMRRWYQQKLWSTLVVIMSLLLLFQVAYFKFDYFSRVEPFRTTYLFTCPLLGCKVPPMVDILAIETTNLIVRNHPKIADALLVDAILINKAPFEQPFPDLILSFSKIDETPVASRRFTPKDYLGGELAGMKYIPERQPVHISLEIADPGSEAVNYTLATH